jgi:23S rRNA (guanine745-N1)-methyltransferase
VRRLAGLPLADACADLMLDIFAPRNGAEFHRVLRPGGALLVVTPHPDHLAELVGPLGCSTSIRPRPTGSTAVSAGISCWRSNVRTERR